MRAEVTAHRDLRFDGGAPVRAASAIAPLAGGWLIAQDDATNAAWRRTGTTLAVRVFPPVDGHDTFSSAEGTKHLKPDVEAAVPVGSGAVLLLGSGSTPARMRASLVRVDGTGSAFRPAALDPMYTAVAGALGIPVDRVNLEGACVVGQRLRWFQRGNASAGVASASVDVGLVPLLAAVDGDVAAAAVPVGNPLRYDLGTAGGVSLAVTDAVALPDGRIMLSAAAEDTPNAYDDGPVVGAALALLAADGTVTAVTPLPGDVPALKVEGLALRAADPDGVDLVAVVDADDAERAST